MVSPETKNSSIRMYHGPHGQPARRGQGPDPLFGLRPHLEVVVDHGHLAVQQEPGVGGVGLHQGQQRIEQLDQAQPEGLEGLVPLPVPVGVGDDGDTAGGMAAKVTARPHGSRPMWLPAAGMADPWSPHLAAGLPFDPDGPARARHCPARWAARWSAEPGRPVLRGRWPGFDPEGSDPWVTAGRLDHSTRRRGRRPGRRRPRPGRPSGVVDGDRPGLGGGPPRGDPVWASSGCRSTPTTRSGSWPT